MESTRLVLVLALFWTRTTGDLDRNSSALKVDLSVAVRRVDRRFLSVTIDASLAAEERFMSLLSSPKVRTLAKALSPSFLRFGGTRQDFMVFTPQGVRQDSEDSAGASCDGQQLPVWLEDQLKKDWTRQQLILMKEDLQGKYRRVQYTESTVDLLHSFSSCSGMDLVFGLNALLRTSNNTWNSSNAATLLRYFESRRYHTAWELGNEPNSFEKKAGVRVDGEQLGRDFTLLRALMSRSPWQRHAGLYGPDIGQPRDHRAHLLEGFLQTGSEAVDACTWHHYYVNGRDTSLEDFLDPEILDSLIIKTKEVLEKVALVSPQKPVWLGETSSAFGGGAAGLSDTFAAGFMWLDKLGLAALLGLDVVMRQVFIGSGTYHLLDQDLDPLPDYWLSLLYKRLVGQEVLRVEASGRRRVRLYLHCSSRDRYPGGAVTLMTINLGRPAARLRLPARLAGPVEAFMLQAEQPGEEGLTSRSVRLNGQVMKMRDDGTLPDMRAARLPPSEVLQLPAFSLSFFIFTEAQAEACG